MITIRRAETEDQRQVKDLVQEIMGREFGDQTNAYPTNDIENILDAYGGLGEAFFVALDEARVIGTVAIKKEDNRVALMRRLFVAASHRNQKIGLHLIDTVLEFCDEMGYQEIVFKTTSRMEAANKTCQKRGFVQRAKLHLGNIELLKFVCVLPNGSKNSKKG